MYQIESCDSLEIRSNITPLHSFGFIVLHHIAFKIGSYICMLFINMSRTPQIYA